MGNKDMVDPASPDFEPVHLHLSALPAVDQKVLVIHRDHLGGGMAIVHRQGGVISKNGNSEHILIGVLVSL